MKLGHKGGNVLLKKRLIFLLIFLSFIVVSQKNIAAEPCDKDDPGATDKGETIFQNCQNIQFSPPPPQEVDPAETQELELNITARNPPPYHWSIDLTDGGGFGLQFSVTTEPSNTLLIRQDACGTVKIFVSDEHDHICETGVRAKSGRWVLVDSWGCYKARNYKATEINGGDKWEERWCFKYWYTNQTETACNNPGSCGGCGPFPPHTKAPKFIWAACYSATVTCKYCWISSYKHYRWQCP